MRVIIHSDEYYPTSQACAFRMQVFADVFREKGNEVTVITSSANFENAANFSKRKERVIYAPTIRMRKKTTAMRMLNNLSFAITSIFAAFSVGKVDVVITTSPPPLISISGWIIAKIKRAKLIYDVRDIWPDVALEMNSFSENSVFCKVFRAITNFMYNHADLVTTVSPGKVEKVVGYVKPTKRGMVRLVGNGFDRAIADGVIDEAAIRQYEMDYESTCVYIGNVGLAQGIDVILDIAAQTRHKDFRFLIFGKGAEKEKLEKRAMEEGLTNVRFCGILEHSKVFTVLSNAKCSIIPLKNANMKDSVPTKIYESLGLGCPVFLVANGDSCEIVNESKLGVCVSPDAGSQIIDEFDQFIDEYEKYVIHANNAKALMINKYARQSIASDFEEQLQTLVRKQK